MQTFTLENVSEIIDFLPKAGFIVLGELHGVEENAEVVKKILNILLSANKKVYIGFEWLLTPQEEFEINEYLRTGKCPNKLPVFFSDSDGRVTVEHLDLLKHIKLINTTREHPIQIVAFDSSASDYEVEMARKLLTIEPNSLVIVETGSVHARRGGEEKTLVDILSETRETKNIFISYTAGTVNVDGEVYSVTNSSEQQVGVSGQFDFEIEVPVAHHTNTEKLLTSIRNFCRFDDDHTGVIKNKGET